MLIFYCAHIICYALFLIRLKFHNHKTPRTYYGKPIKQEFKKAPHRFYPKKPEWVRQELIKIYAIHMHRWSYQEVTNYFNLVHEHKHQMTISHSYVGKLLKNNRHKVLVLRRKLKNKTPHSYLPNEIWGMDITHLPTEHDGNQMILGMIDYHSRYDVCLKRIYTKASIHIIKELCNVIEKLNYQKPNIIRTDNERCFTSWLFKLALKLLGVKHQTTDVASPWQNGRIERYFGKLKAKAKNLVWDNIKHLEQGLLEYQFWYRHIHRHQYLSGNSTHEAYFNLSNTNRIYLNPKSLNYFQAWNGRIAGYYFPH